MMRGAAKSTGLWQAGACLFAIVLVAGAALADGFMSPAIEQVGESAAMVSSPRQEAILATDGRTVTVTLRTHFLAGPKELAWIVPVPAKPDKVEPADEAVFAALDRACAPKFYRVVHSGRGLSCGCGVSAAGQAELGTSVVVEATGTAGIFQYAVLAAGKAEDLTRWLEENGYRVPVRAERVIDGYVRAGWHWLAMRVRPEESDKSTLAPHPIRYTYSSGSLTYPLVISQLSAHLTNEIVLYVAAAGRYACGNWPNASIDEVTADGADLREADGSASGTNYERLFQGRTEAAGGRLFVTEYAAAGELAVAASPHISRSGPSSLE